MNGDRQQSCPLFNHNPLLLVITREYPDREIPENTGITITGTGEPGKGARFEILVPDGRYRETK